MFSAPAHTRPLGPLTFTTLTMSFLAELLQKLRAIGGWLVMVGLVNSKINRLMIGQSF